MRIAAHCLFLFAGALPCLAADDPDAQKEQIDRWMAFYEQEIKAIKINFDDAERTPLELIEQPVLKWTNPTRANQIHGVVYIWAHRGRAQVMGSIWSHVSSSRPNNRTVGHQFHSLSEQPLVAEKRGAVFWSPKTSGIDPRPLPGAEPPANTRAARLVQMRSFARDFDGDGEEFDKRRGIRLLTQPLHRQEQPLGEIEDGALFTFAMGTDPEAILLIEARRTADGPRWHYSVGRFSGLQTDLKYKDDVVWSYRGPAQQFDPGKPYLANYNVMVKPINLAASGE